MQVMTDDGDVELECDIHVVGNKVLLGMSRSYTVGRDRSQAKLDSKDS